MALDDAVFAVNRDAWEVAHMLVGPGQLVEKRGLAAVLVADKRKGEGRIVGQGVAGALGVELALLAEAWVSGPLLRCQCGCRWCLFNARLDGNLGRVVQTKRERVPVDEKLHRVTHGSVLHEGNAGARDDAHIKKVLA